MKTRILKYGFALLFLLHFTLSCTSDDNTVTGTTDSSSKVSNVTFTGTGSGTGGAYKSGDTITISADVSDPNGVFRVDFILSDISGNMIGICNASLMTGDTFSCSLTLNFSGFDGSEYISISVVDNSYNQDSYYDSGLSTLNYAKNSSITDSGVPIVFIALETGGTVDSTPPVITNVSFTGTGSGTDGAFMPDDVITVSADVTDTLGVFGVIFSVTNNLGNDYGECIANLTSGSTWSCDITLFGVSFNGSEYIQVSTADSGFNEELLVVSGASVTHYTKLSDNSVSTEPIEFIILESVWPPATAGSLTVGSAYSSFTVNKPLFVSVNVTSGTSYTIYWDDEFDGSGAYTADVQTSAYYADETPLFESIDSGYPGGAEDYSGANGMQFTAVQTGIVYILLDPYYGTGTVGVRVISP